MKNKFFRRFKIFFFLLCFGLTVFGCGYFYLDGRLKEATASNKTESVPYYSSLPQNCSVMFNICNDKILVNLDFEQEILSVIFPEEPVASDTDIYGYHVNFTLSSDYELIGFLVDLVGGIELDTEGEVLRYTGVQISEKLKFSNVSLDIKKQIAAKIISGIVNSGFTKENLLYIIENSETDLKFNESFRWVEYIPELCKFVRFID